MTWEEIKLKSYEIDEMRFSTDLKRHPCNKVIDENKSVKWNREEVARLNEEYNTARSLFYESKQMEYNKIGESAIERISEDLNETVTRDSAAAIWKHATKLADEYDLDHATEIAEDLVELISKIQWRENK